MPTDVWPVTGRIGCGSLLCIRRKPKQIRSIAVQLLSCIVRAIEAKKNKGELTWQASEQIGIHRHVHTAGPVRHFPNGRKRSMKRKLLAFGAASVAGTNSRQKTKFLPLRLPTLNYS